MKKSKFHKGSKKMLCEKNLGFINFLAIKISKKAIKSKTKLIELFKNFKGIIKNHWLWCFCKGSNNS